MRVVRCVAAAVLVVSSLTPAHAQDVWTLSRQAMEAFLRNADLSDFRDAGEGVTRSQRATATDGTLTEDVRVQIVDQQPPGFVAEGEAARPDLGSLGGGDRGHPPPGAAVTDPAPERSPGPALPGPDRQVRGALGDYRLDSAALNRRASGRFEEAR